jgi:hypothetical protein
MTEKLELHCQYIAKDSVVVEGNPWVDNTFWVIVYHREPRMDGEDSLSVKLSVDQAKQLRKWLKQWLKEQK